MSVPPAPGVLTSQVRVAERSTEGLHAIVKRSLSRAPRAKLSYLSMELRFAQFGKMEEDYARLCCLSGFRQGVLHLDGRAGMAGSEIDGRARLYCIAALHWLP